jgi:hypothetical protein
MSNHSASLKPAEGEIVHDSPLRTLGLCALVIFVVAPIGAGLAWAWWNGASLLNWQVTWYGGLIGALFVLGGVLAVPLSILCFIRRNRLILGKESIQLVRGENVTIQIPYRNIARIGLAEDELLGKFIGIDLHEPTAPGTLCPVTDMTKNSFGWHYTLKDESWTLPLAQIHDQLKSRLPVSSGKH